MRAKRCDIAPVSSCLTFALFIPLAYTAARGWCSSSPAAAPSVDELLTRYGQTMDKCLHSFAVKSRSTMETYWRQSPDPRAPPGHYVAHRKDDFRYDGQRTRDMSGDWGDVDWHRPTPENNPIRRSAIFDFEFNALYSGQRGQPGFIHYYKEPLDARKVTRQLTIGWSPAPSFGFWPFYERVDLSVRKSQRATVRAQTERVNGSSCYVIEAHTAEGRLAVWLDPAHGYNIARITVTLRGGDLADGQVLPRGHEVARVFTNTTFKQVDGTWIPTAYVTQTRINRPGLMVMEGETRCEITEFLIEPDHAALKSFDLSDFPEGERVAYFENGRIRPVWYIWKNGQPVPDTRGSPPHPRSRTGDKAGP
jgi:hypothetical protein